MRVFYDIGRYVLYTYMHTRMFEQESVTYTARKDTENTDGSAWDFVEILMDRRMGLIEVWL